MEGSVLRQAIKDPLGEPALYIIANKRVQNDYFNSFLLKYKKKIENYIT